MIGRSEKPEEIDEARRDAFYRAKSRALEQVLGPMHEMVGHAIIGVHVGGNVHMYYYQQTLAGTCFATKEFVEPDGTGPKRSRIGLYELVAFTRLAKPASGAGPERERTPFDLIERRMCAIFSILWGYAKEHALNPGETCEVPLKDDDIAAVIFDDYKGKEEFWIEGRKYGLLLCIQVFPSELIFAQQRGTGALVERLKQAGHFPYSDLDRAPVV